MRQKFNKHATDAFFAEHGVITTPQQLNLQGPLHIEIGSGKGKFITDMAHDHPEEMFVAFEVNRHVAYYIVMKKLELNLSNLIIVIDDAERLDAYVHPSSVSNIYLNFSDPWPKKKHHKRRLTFSSKLKLYKKLLIHQGKIFFRTDHLDLYMDSCFYFQEVFETVAFDDDAPLGPYVSEYELKKRPFGPIYTITVEVNK